MIPVTKQSKPIGKLKKGDKILIHGKPMEVEGAGLIEEHDKGSKEMFVDVFDSASEREFQVRYFDDQVESSVEVYELMNEFQYVRKEPKSISW